MQQDCTSKYKVFTPVLLNSMNVNIADIAPRLHVGQGRATAWVTSHRRGQARLRGEDESSHHIFIYKYTQQLSHTQPIWAHHV